MTEKPIMNSSTTTNDDLDAAKVPYRTAYTGARIPALGLGTFGSDRFSGEVIAEAVKGAIALGYRHIDCAAVYSNEHLIGQVLRDATTVNGIKREELWITSKLWNDKHNEADVIPRMVRKLIFG